MHITNTVSLDRTLRVGYWLKKNADCSPPEWELWLPCHASTIKEKVPCKNNGWIIAFFLNKQKQLSLKKWRNNDDTVAKRLLFFADVRYMNSRIWNLLSTTLSILHVKHATMMKKPLAERIVLHGRFAGYIRRGNAKNAL